MAMTAQEVAQKWRNNTTAATASIEAGVRGVTESPTVKAARRKEAYKEGVRRAADDGTWERGLLSVSRDDWVQAMLTKGIPRIATGVAAAEGEFASFMGEFLPHVNAGRDAINRSMPRGGLEQNIARATAMMRHNAQFKRSRR